MKIIIRKAVLTGALLCAVISFNLLTEQRSERLLPAKQAEIAELCYLTELTPTLGTTVSQDVVKTASQSWLRTAGKERWESLFSITFSDEQQKRVVTLFDRIGFFTPHSPKKQEYTHACLFGATVPTMEKRIYYWVELWNKGVRWQNNVLLTGARQLTATIDVMHDGTSFTQATTETEACVALWQHLSDRGVIPTQMQQLPMIVIAVPLKQSPSGVLQRPTTEDTLAQLIGQVHTTHDGSQSYLFISCQPHVLYQSLIVDYAFRDIQADIDVVGARYEFTDKTTIGTLFDALARCLYVQDKLDTYSTCH